MKVVYMCHGGFKNRGLRERLLTENGGFQNWLLELKITKKHIFV